MATELLSRVQTSARRYRGSTMRYLLRPPLALTPKYVAFLVDLVHQTDHMQEVLGRAADRLASRSSDSGGEPSGEFRVEIRSGELNLESLLASTRHMTQGRRLAAILRLYQKEERARMQLALADLRRLGYQQESLPPRQPSAGDTALRAYGTSLSYDRPHAMLGLLCTIIGVAGELSQTVLRLLTMSKVPREAMRWLQLRADLDPAGTKELVETIAREVRDPAQQAAVLEAVEVSGELLAVGAASRKSL